MQRVNIKNWTHARFQKDNFMALITFGANPESIQEERLEYYVTVLENEIHEFFQKEFSSLTEACLYLNSHYGDWAFSDQLAPQTGCSTCAAH